MPISTKRVAFLIAFLGVISLMAFTWFVLIQGMTLHSTQPPQVKVEFGPGEMEVGDDKGDDPEGEPEPRQDLNDGQLPEHALLRIGNTRLRPNVHGRGYLTATVFTADGERLVTFNQFSGAQVWDTATRKKLLSFGKPASFGGMTYALTEDGSRAAVIESEKVCRFYDTATGKRIGAANGKWSSVWDLRFSPSNKLLGVYQYSDKCVEVWDVASGSRIWRIPVSRDRNYGAFAFAPDEKMVVFAPRVGNEGPPHRKEDDRLLLSLYDAPTGTKLQYAGEIETASAHTLAFSPDGKILAAMEHSREFVLWDFTTGKLLHEPTIDEGWVVCRCFSRDGKWIATGSNHGFVCLWDVATGKLIRKFPHQDGTIYSLAFSRNGKRLAAGIDDNLRVWDVATGNDAFAFDGHRMRNVQACFSGDGKSILSLCGFNSNPSRSADERTLRFWDSTTGKPLKQVELDRKEFLPFSLSEDGRMLFVVDNGEITKQNLVTGKVDKVLGLPVDYSVYRSSMDGKYLAAATASYWDTNERGALGHTFIRVVDTTTGKEVFALDGKTGEYFVIDFTQNGPILVANTFRYELVQTSFRPSFDLKESYLTLWDVSTGRKLQDSNLLPKKWEAHAPWPSGDKLSPNGHYALTRGKDGVELRELATNATVADFSLGSGNPESWSFSKDGKFFAVGTEKGQILLWSVLPPKPLVTFSGHSAAVTSVHFSPDGQRLVSGSNDTTIIVWDVLPWTGPATNP
jgi:WD40 repeat protein